MHDIHLQQQVDAALRHAVRIALSGQDMYHDDCTVILSALQIASATQTVEVVTVMLSKLDDIAYPDGDFAPGRDLDQSLLIALEAVGDILEAQPQMGLTGGVRRICDWLHICLRARDHKRIQQLCDAITTFTERVQEIAQSFPTVITGTVH